jgi:hypothetical protein
MSETKRCEECGHKLDDGYTAEETLCGACFNAGEADNYDFVLGLGDTITCDDCYNIAENWFCDHARAICEDCYEKIARAKA